VSESDDRQRRILASNRRWRVIFAALALVVPLALGLLFRRHELLLRALADHGRAGTAVVSSIERSQGVLYTHYRYDVDGASYTWSVSREDAPFAVGAPVPITYLPEDASLSRPGAYTAARLEAELGSGLFRVGFPAGLFVFFALSAALCHYFVVRQEKGIPPRARPWIGPVGLGRFLGAIFVGIGVLTGFDPKARVVQEKLAGPTPFGLPVSVVFAVSTGVLLAPLLWVCPHLMTIVVASAAKGGSLSRLGVVVAVAKAGPELRRSRAIVIGGFVYLMAVFAAWIAWTASRGV
jgi:hypothetical protein